MRTRSAFISRCLAFVACSVMSVGSASARTTDGALNVGMRVVKSCDFAVGRMDFGVVGFLTPTTDQTAPILVVCTPNTPFTVTLDGGQNLAGSTRQMKRITGIFPPTFPYTIFKDAGRTSVWGINEAVPGNSGPTGKLTMQLYGRVTGLSLSLGTYSDTVVVTFAF